MKCYLIIYDLRKYRNYDTLIQAIRSYGTWGKITESVWAIVTAQNAVQIRTYLTQFIDSDDRLMIIKSGAEAAWKNAIANDQWLQQQLTKA